MIPTGFYAWVMWAGIVEENSPVYGDATPWETPYFNLAGHHIPTWALMDYSVAVGVGSLLAFLVPMALYWGGKIGKTTAFVFFVLFCVFMLFLRPVHDPTPAIDGQVGSDLVYWAMVWCLPGMVFLGFGKGVEAICLVFKRAREFPLQLEAEMAAERAAKGSVVDQLYRWLQSTNGKVWVGGLALVLIWYLGRAAIELKNSFFSIGTFGWLESNDLVVYKNNSIQRIHLGLPNSHANVWVAGEKLYTIRNQQLYNLGLQGQATAVGPKIPARFVVSNVFDLHGNLIVERNDEPENDIAHTLLLVYLGNKTSWISEPDVSLQAASIPRAWFEWLRPFTLTKNGIIRTRRDYDLATKGQSCLAYDREAVHYITPSGAGTWCTLIFDPISGASFIDQTHILISTTGFFSLENPTYVINCDSGGARYVGELGWPVSYPILSESEIKLINTWLHGGPAKH